MEERSIDDLIRELKELKVRETTLLNQLEAANNRREGNERHQQKGNAGAPNDQEGIFRPGQRVYITNRIRRPINWSGIWEAHKERFATVTRQSSNKVFVRTDNGVDTWRAPKNLSKLKQNERAN